MSVMENLKKEDIVKSAVIQMFANAITEYGETAVEAAVDPNTMKAATYINEEMRKITEKYGDRANICFGKLIDASVGTDEESEQTIPEEPKKVKKATKKIKETKKDDTSRSLVKGRKKKAALIISKSEIQEEKIYSGSHDNEDPSMEADFINQPESNTPQVYTNAEEALIGIIENVKNEIGKRQYSMLIANDMVILKDIILSSHDCEKLYDRLEELGDEVRELIYPGLCNNWDVITEAYHFGQDYDQNNDDDDDFDEV